MSTMNCVRRMSLILVIIFVIILGTTRARATDVIGTIQSMIEFSTFMAALEAAGLVSKLKGKDLFTVFVPTNKAFERLPPGALDDLMKPEYRGKLRRLLNHHIVAGLVSATALVGKVIQKKPIEGSMLKIDGLKMGIKIDEAMIETPDMAADNGVIHSVDRVLFPQ